MDSGYYAAMTGLVARNQALDAAAANLANAETPGYRAEREFFRSALMGPDAGDSQLGRAVNSFGLLGGDQLFLGQGQLQQTGNPLDLAIEGEGFFAVQAPSGVKYTRDGSFHRTQTGQLVNNAGEPVLSTTLKPIAVPPGDVSVGADGVLSVAGGVSSAVGVFTFAAGTRLTPEGANSYAPPKGTTPNLSKNATVRQGAIEAANQDTITGSLDLVAMQRQAEMMQKALTIFHTEFNKIASEDLPKV
jgi:flagellar basal-body rod protein FlgF/flagellar basal-body rod protein FlgG